jgi:hypothetical protein
MKQTWQINWRVVGIIVFWVIILDAAFPPGQPWHWVSYLTWGPLGIILALFGFHAIEKK